MLGQLAAGQIVVADFEAGLGTLSRMSPGQLDRLLIVSEPTAKSLEVARRAVEMAREVGPAHVVANRVRDDPDRERVRSAFPDSHVVLVPDDPAVRAADARGAAPFDACPGAPAVQAVRALADALLAS